jgi:transposase
MIRFKQFLNETKKFSDAERADLVKHASNPDISHKEIAKRLNDVHDNNRNEQGIHAALKLHYPDAPKRSGKGQRYRWDSEALQYLKDTHTKHGGHVHSIAREMNIPHEEISHAIKRYGHEVGIKYEGSQSRLVKVTDVFKHRKQGMIDAHIAKRLRVSSATLYNAVKNQGHHPEFVAQNSGKPKWDDERLAELKHHASDPKLSHEEIGQRLTPQRDRHQVNQAIRKHGAKLGIPPRKRKKIAWWKR